jgi:hypothetical protein
MSSQHLSSLSSYTICYLLLSPLVWTYKMSNEEGASTDVATCNGLKSCQPVSMPEQDSLAISPADIVASVSANTPKSPPRKRPFCNRYGGCAPFTNRRWALASSFDFKNIATQWSGKTALRTANRRS